MIEKIPGMINGKIQMPSETLPQKSLKGTLLKETTEQEQQQEMIEAYGESTAKQIIKLEDKEDTLSMTNTLLRTYAMTETEEKLKIENRYQKDLDEFVFSEKIPMGYTNEEWEQAKKNILQKRLQLIEDIEFRKSLYDESLKNSAWYNKVVSAPITETIYDLFNPTDIGDVGSAIKTAVTVGGTLIGGPGVGAMVKEAVGSGIIYAGATMMQKRNEEGKWGSGTDYVMEVGKEVIGDLVGQTVLKGVVKGIIKGIDVSKTGYKKIFQTPRKAGDEVLATAEDLAEKEIITNTRKSIIKDVEVEPVVEVNVKNYKPQKGRNRTNNKKNISKKRTPKYTRKPMYNTEVGIESSPAFVDTDIRFNKTAKNISMDYYNKATGTTDGKKILDLTGANDGEIYINSNIDNSFKKNLKLEKNISDLGIEQTSYSVSHKLFPSHGDKVYNFIKANQGIEWLEKATSRDINDIVLRNKDEITHYINEQIKTNRDDMVISVYNLYDSYASQKINGQSIDIKKVVNKDNKTISDFTGTLVGYIRDNKSDVVNDLFLGLETISNGQYKTTVDLYKDIKTKTGKDLMYYILKKESTGDETLDGTIKFFKDKVYNFVLKTNVEKTYSELDFEKFSNILGAKEIYKYFDSFVDGDGNLSYVLKNEVEFNLESIGVSKLKNILDENKIDLNLGFLNPKTTQKEFFSKIAEYRKLTKEEAEALKTAFKEYKTVTKGEGQVQELMETLIKQKDNHSKGIKNRIFNIVNKKTVLENLENISTKTDPVTGMIDKKNKRFFLNEEQAYKLAKEKDLEFKTTEFTDDLNKKVKLFNEASSLKSYETFKKYLGITIPDSKGVKGATKVIDIEKLSYNQYIKQRYGTDVNTLKSRVNSAKRNGYVKDGLSPNSVISSEIGNQMNDLVADYSRNIGKNIADQYPNMTIDEIFLKLVEKEGIPSVKLKYSDLSDGILGAYVPSKNIIELPIETKNFYDTLGTLRHEIQHAKEVLLEPDAIKYYSGESFVNHRTLTSEMIDGLLKGNLSIREAIGKFYNNHFYNFQTDTFERSFLEVELSESLAKLTPYDRYANFIKSLSETTSTAVKDKVKFSDLIGTDIAGTNEILKQMSKNADGTEEVMIKAMFKNDDAFNDFIYEMVKDDGVQQIGALQSKITNGMLKEKIGFTEDELSSLFISKNIAKELELKYGYNNNQDVEHVFRTLGEYMKALKTTRQITDASKMETATKWLSFTLIGSRFMKDGMSVISNSGLTKIAGGEVGEAWKSLPRVAGTVGKNVVESFGISSGVAIETTMLTSKYVARVMDKVIKNTTFREKEVFLTQNLTNRIADKVIENVDRYRAKWGKTDFAKVHNSQIILQRYMNDMDLLSKNIESDSLTGTVTKVAGIGSVTSMADDFSGYLIAKTDSELAISDMFTKNSYEELKDIQKRIYVQSGYKKEYFNEFKEAFANEFDEFIKSKKSIDELNNLRLQMMLRSGINAYSVADASKIRIRGAMDSFSYMTQTLKSHSWELWRRFRTKYSDGVAVGNKGFVEMTKNFANIVPFMLTMGGAYYGYSAVQESIREQENILDIMTEDLNKAKKGKVNKREISKAIGVITVGSTFIEGTSSVTPAQLGYSFLTRQGLGKMVLRSYWGAYVDTMYNTFKKFYKQEEAEKRTRRYLKTKKAYKQFSKLYDDNYEKTALEYYKFFSTEYIDSLNYLYENEKISKEEFMEKMNRFA